MGQIQYVIARKIAPFLDHLPPTKGAFEVPKHLFYDEVEIYRDDNGMAHVKAQNLHDMYAGLGFVEACDRLFQLEIYRRMGIGRLAELLGPEVLTLDQIARGMKWRELGEGDFEFIKSQAETDERFKISVENLQGYIDGINAYSQNPNTKFPAEFGLWNYKPEPFTCSQLLAFARGMYFKMAYGWQTQMIQARLAQIVGVGNALCFTSGYDTSNGICSHPDMSVDKKETRLEEFGLSENDAKAKVEDIYKMSHLNDMNLAEVLKVIGEPHPAIGSNSWGVAGEFTESGFPILCSDPHLSLSSPHSSYTVHIHCDNPSFDAVGATCTFMPMFSSARMEKTAVALTLSFCDCQDLFVERLDLSNGTYQENENEWRNLESFDEVIKVSGAPDCKMTFHRTSRGLLISEIGVHPFEDSVLQDYQTSDEDPYKYEFSLASPLDIPHSSCIVGLFMAHFANTFEEFHDACGMIDIAQLSYGWASETDIGVCVTGRMPIKGDGALSGLPSPGWDSRFHWKKEADGQVACVPPEHMPFTHNPKRGFFVAANNALVNYDKYPYFFGNMFVPSTRAKRIQDVIEAAIKEGKKINVDMMKKLQLDVRSNTGAQFVEIVEQFFPLDEETGRYLDDELENKAIEILRDWGVENSEVNKCSQGEPFVASKESFATSIYRVWLDEIFQQVLVGGLNSALEEQQKEATTQQENKEFIRVVKGEGLCMLVQDETPLAFLAHQQIMEMIKHDDQCWWIARAGGTLPLMKASLKRAVAFLVDTFGKDPTTWRWGSLNKARIGHFFSEVFGPEPFDLPPIECAGDCSSVNICSKNIANGYEPSEIGCATIRFITDFKDEKSSLMFPSGISGQLTSKFRNNMMDRFLNGDYLTFDPNFEEISKKADLLTIKPKAPAEPQASRGSFNWKSLFNQMNCRFGF